MDGHGLGRAGVGKGDRRWRWLVRELARVRVCAGIDAAVGGAPGEEIRRARVGSCADIEEELHLDFALKRELEEDDEAAAVAMEAEEAGRGDRAVGKDDIEREADMSAGGTRTIQPAIDKS